MMLWFYVSLFASCSVVWSKPISQNPYLSDIDSDPWLDVRLNPVDTGTINDNFIPSNLNNVDYPLKTSANDDANPVRKRGTFCSAISTKTRNINLNRRPMLIEPSDQDCPDPIKKLPVTCAGPEAWELDNSRLHYVGNCEAGIYIYIYIFFLLLYFQFTFSIQGNNLMNLIRS